MPNRDTKKKKGFPTFLSIKFVKVSRPNSLKFKDTTEHS